MFERIIQRENLQEAFKKIKKNNGSGGIDKVSIRQYEQNLDQNIQELERLLTQNRYVPLPARRVYIPKSNGKKRPLGIPAIKDRIVQEAIRSEVQPIFEKTFSDSSYGFRPGRSAISAINKVQEYSDQGYEYIVEADIRDFFTKINHQRLMSKIKEEIKDGKVRKLIWKFLKAGVMEEGKRKKEVSGTPQGGVISLLLANIYLNSFDHAIERSGLKFVRYADDFVILCKSAN
ncbi:MAG: group II intron reverse transcriptase/maturase [Candidatus Magasanikbacteria bacterium]|nr:group II intron reverse transcriptase/maturase [Candidatus Magasanikbacteria bacterium]